MHLLKVGLRVPAKVRACQGTITKPILDGGTCWRLCAVLKKEAHHTSWSHCPTRDRANGNLMPGSGSLLEEAQMRHLANWQDCFPVSAVALMAGKSDGRVRAGGTLET